MSINWGLLQPTNPAAALQAGIQSGQAWRRESDTRGALSALAADPTNAQAMGVLRQAAPEVAFKMEDRLRADKTRGILSRVFAGEQRQSVAPALSFTQGGAAPQGALQSPAPGGGGQPAFGSTATGMASPAVGPIAGAPAASGDSAMSAPSSAPTTLVDPATLPARTDGIKLNPAAMQELYRDDPVSAFKIQEMVYNADASAFKRVQASGGVLASAARHLGKIVNADGTPDLSGRQAEFQAMAPMLQQYGVTPEMMGKVDLTDVGLNRYFDLGRNLNTLIDDDRADRRLDASVADDQADNARADRNTESVIEDRGARRGLIARGQDLTDSRGRYGISVASGDRRRGQDIGAGTTRRGQDVTDKRIREGFGGSGGRRRVAPGTGAPRVPGTAETPAIVTSIEQAKLLPKGTYFQTPDGKVKVR